MRVGRRSTNEIVCASDTDDESESDGMDIKLHTKFEKADYLPNLNLNLRKVDERLEHLKLEELEKELMKKESSDGNPKFDIAVGKSKFVFENPEKLEKTVDSCLDGLEAIFYRRYP